MFCFVIYRELIFSGGRTRGDPECFQGGLAVLPVQRQSKHESWGAGLRDGHQMDQTRPQLQSPGTKIKTAKQSVNEVCDFSSPTLLYPNDHPLCAPSGQKKTPPKKTTNRSLCSVCLQRCISVVVPLIHCSWRLHNQTKNKEDEWLLIVFSSCSSAPKCYCTCFLMKMKIYSPV